MMFKKLTTAAIVALGLATGASAKEVGPIENIDFSFDGPFGTYDQLQLQRGLQVYTEVCSACHGLKFVPLRTLGDSGGPQLPEDQVRAYAKQFEIVDAETGETRPRKPTDKFPASALAGAPDLSLMAKARAGFSGPMGLGINQFLKGMGGAEHIVAILDSYTGKEKTEYGATLYENTAFPGGWISMAPPLAGEDVTFADGAPNDLKSESEDVAAFLMWTAEPKLSNRKMVGLLGFGLLGLLSVLLYLTNKRIWAPAKRKAKQAAK